MSRREGKTLLMICSIFTIKNAAFAALAVTQGWNVVAWIMVFLGIAWCILGAALHAKMEREARRAGGWEGQA